MCWVWVLAGKVNMPTSSLCRRDERRLRPFHTHVGLATAYVVLLTPNRILFK